MSEAAAETENYAGRSRTGDVARAALLDAARRVAAREGIERIRLSAVADEANIAHATAYGYFRSRRDLLQSIVAEDLNALTRAMRNAAGLPEPANSAQPPSQIVRFELSPAVRDDGHLRDVSLGTSDEAFPMNESAVKTMQPRSDVVSVAPSGQGSDLRQLERLLSNLESAISSLDARTARTLANLAADLDDLRRKYAELEARIGGVAAHPPAQSAAVPTTTAAANEEASTEPVQQEERHGIADEPLLLTDEVPVEASSETQQDDEHKADSGQGASPADIVPAASEPSDLRVVPADYLSIARRSAMSAVANQIADSKRATSEKKSRSTRVMVAAAAAAVLLVGGAAVGFREFAARTPSVAAGQKIVHAGVTHSSRHANGAARALTPLDRVTQDARAGKPDAELAVGLKYLTGDGIAKNESEAANWIARAAQAGNATAQGWLGSLYAHGKGVAADPSLAFSWFEKAAQQGNAKAMHDLAIAYAQGSGVAVNYFEAARLFARAADLGYVDSAFNLAVLYERGDGVPQSLLDAYKWYAIAAASGDEESKTRMSAIASELSPDDLAAAQKAAAAFKPSTTPTTPDVLPTKS